MRGGIRVEDHVPVNIHTVKDVSFFNLYLKVPTENEIKFILYRNGDKESGGKSDNTLSPPDTGLLYVKREDHNKYLSHIQNNFREILIEHKTDSKKLSQIIYNVLENVVDSLFKPNITREKIKETQDIVDSSIEQILKRDVTPYLINLGIQDHIKYIHMVNCFILAVFFAKYLNYDESDLQKIGIGALLHDIGEMLLNPALRNLQKAFTPGERKMMQEHPYLGFKLLQKMNCLDPKVLFMVWEHHERWNGQGYPKRLRQEEIGEFGRMLGMVDVYAAMTTNRPYRKAHTPFQALKIMINSKQFNKHELNSFITFLSSSKIRIE